MTERPLLVVMAGDLISRFPQEAFAERVTFVGARTDEDLRAAVRDANVLYSWQVPRNVPAETPRLRWVQLPSAGSDHLRHLPIWASDVVITASQGIHTVPMSEHFFALALALTRQIAPLVRAQTEREWLHNVGGSHHRPGELRGKTLGILGWGKIGEGVAHLARAFGMRVIGTRWSAVVPREQQRPLAAYVDPPWLEQVEDEPDIVYPTAQLGEVFAQSDLILSLLPLTDATRGSIGERAFRSMKRGALFFNLGRGPVVDEDALIRALQEGRLGGAGLDVFAQEPLPRSSPLWSMRNVIISPHIGGVSDMTRERGIHLFAVNLARFLEGQPLLNVVDRQGGY